MRCTMRGALALLIAAAFAPAQVAEVQVEPVQLTVRRKPKIDGVKMFGDPGVELQVAVRVPGKPILSVDTDKSSIVRFVDDLGTDLAKGAPTGFFSWLSLANAFREEPTEACLIDVKTSSLPGAGARTIEFDAKVAFVAASGSTSKTEKVALEKGAKITVGPVPMRIESVEKSDFGGTELTVQISSDQRMDTIRELEFLDAAGERIEVEAMGESSFGFGNKKTYSKNFGFPKKLTAVTVRVVAYAEMETIVVPVKFQLGVGLR